MYFALQHITMSTGTRRLSRTEHKPLAVVDPLSLLNIAFTAENGSLAVSWQTNKPADSRAALYFGPAKHSTWDLQLGMSTVDTVNNDQVYDFDGFDHSASEVSALHASGHYAIAYFSAGSSENWRPDYKTFPASVKGNTLSGWAGENWLDIRQISVLEPIMAARADIAKNKGFNAIDWDNVDGYLNKSGFALTAADQTAYNKMLARITHERGMAAFLKNCTNLVSTLEPYFEGGVVEQSYEYSEETAYMPFSAANKPLLEVEYSASFCSAANQQDANTRGYSLILQTLNLDSPRTASYVTNPPLAVALTNTASPNINATLTTTHTQTFTGLTPGQQYGFLVWSVVGSEKVYDTIPRTFVAA